MTSRSNSINDELIRPYIGKTVLIDGSSGFIGSALAEKFSDIPCKLILIDKNKSNYSSRQTSAKIIRLTGDVSKSAVWDKVLKNADYVFHLAALEYDRKCFDVDKDININSMSVIRMLESHIRTGSKARIIFSSSANLYGLAKKLPVNEKSPTDIVSLWSAHKALAENYIQVYSAKFGIEAVTLRLVNVYGPSPNEKSLMNVVINRAISDAIYTGSIKLFGNNQCIRDYLYIDDAVNAFIAAGANIKKLKGADHYVIGTGEKKTIKQVWRIISDKVSKAIKRKVSIDIRNNVVLEPFDMRNFIADPSLFRKITGWRPEVRTEKGIELTIDKLISRGGNNGRSIK